MANDNGGPLTFAPNRVWRAYRGGRELGRFLGEGVPRDGNFPEEWLASTTPARNGPHQQRPGEGLSRLAGGAAETLQQYLAAHPGFLGAAAGPDGGFGVLCKFLDSAVRLPVQCHPDRAFARAHYNSPYGKEEAWFVLATRQDQDEEPYLLMGFRPGVTREDFVEATGRGDGRALVSMLHRFPVAPGQAYRLPGRFPHAIGPGVLILEVMEPSDWVVQPEETIGGEPLSDWDRWGPLAPDVALDCFDFDSAAPAAAVASRVRLAGRERAVGAAMRCELLIGPEETLAFAVERLTADAGADFAGDPERACLFIVTAGRGRLRGEETVALQPGSAVLLPATDAVFRLEPEGELHAYRVTPGPAPV